MTKRKDNRNRVLEKGESQRKDGIYMYRYQDMAGNRRCIYNSNLSELREKEKKIRRDLEDGINTKAAERTLNEQFSLYMSLKTQLANSTRTNYIDLWENNLRNNSLGMKKLTQIRKSDILGFYNSLVERGLKYSTIKTFNCMIAPCLQLAVDDDVIRKNPCNGCLQQFLGGDSAEKNAMSKEQQWKMLNYVKRHNVYSAYYPMIAFMIETAVRCGEAIGLTWSDVDFKNKTVRINHQLIYKKRDGEYRFYADSPKTDAGVRVIPLTSIALSALSEQRRMQFEKGQRTDVEIDGYSDFVFSTKNKNPIMPSAVNNVLLNIVNALNRDYPGENFPRVSAHILRHTGCTRMAEAGIDPKVLQYIMGHSKISVTMEIYNHVSEERNRREIEKLEKHRLAE